MEGRTAPAPEDSGERSSVSGCVFCDIIRSGKTTDGSAILHEDEICIAIQDIAPAAHHHFLVIPKAHIATTNELGQRDRGLAKHLYKVGLKLIEEANPEAKYRCNFGYHQPPFNRVDHLHMHCLCPPYKSVFHSMKYVGQPWFITAEAIIKRLSLR